MKLNLGCGWDIREGYVNIDFSPHHRPNVVGDVFRLPIRTGSATEIFAQDVLEHLPRTSTDDALNEWRRVLADDGVARIRMPSLFHAVDIMRRDYRLETHLLLLQNLYGTQAYTGDVHLTSFTDLTIATSLHQAGFRDVRAQLVDEWMWDITAGASEQAPVAVFMGSGCYAPEFSGSSEWRWISQQAEISIVNSSAATQQVAFTGAVATPSQPGGKVVLSSSDGATSVLTDGDPFQFVVSVPPNDRRVVRWECDLPQVPSPGDARLLYFQWITPFVQILV